jgi:hypothetical protein
MLLTKYVLLILFTLDDIALMNYGQESNSMSTT